MFLVKFLILLTAFLWVMNLIKGKKTPSDKRFNPLTLVIIAALLLTGLTALKLYFVYKLAIGIFVLVLGVLSLWGYKGFFRG